MPNKNKPKVIIKIKTITLKLSLPIKDLQEGKTFVVSIDDDASIIEALAMVDKFVYENPSESIFPLYEGYIHYYLQLFVNIEENLIYEDVGVSPYAPDDNGFLRKFNPIGENIYFNLFPNSVIDLQQDFGC
ncbi:MAG: hypothetical protein ACFFAS_19990 [Promethearchaeota archaeon]